MAVTKHLQRKLVLVTYDKELVRGHEVSCQFGHPGGEVIEKKNSPNTGHLYFTVGESFTGKVECKVVGSSGGEDSGEVEVA